MEIVCLCPTSPDVGCLWEGPATEIVSHFRYDHQELLLHSNRFYIDVSRCGTQNKLLCLDNETYLIQTNVELPSGLLELKLRYVGPHKKALAFTYDLEICIGRIAFKLMLGEKCNPVTAKKGYIEADLDLIALASGCDALRKVLCILHITNTSPIGTPQIECPDIQNSSDIESNASSEKVEESGDSTNNNINNSEDQVDSLILRPRSPKIKRQSSLRSSFWGSFFFEDLNIPPKRSESFTSLQSYSVIETDDGTDNEEEKCATCNERLCPPIFLCAEGHSVCGLCKFVSCKLCSQPITDIRNTDLEEICKKVNRRCKWGCFEKHPYEEIRLHEVSCRLCEYKCCLCPTKGNFEAIRTHFKLLHSSVKVHENLTNKFARNSTFAIISRLVGIFYCCCEMKNNRILWSASYCGPPDLWFSCELKFKGKKSDMSYFLQRNSRANIYKLSLDLNSLKSLGIKDKYATLTVSNY